MSIGPTHHIDVGICCDDRTLAVGKLVEHEKRVHFEYSQECLQQGIEISPLKLPLRPGVFSFDPLLFHGLPGVFHDSIPDGWGQLLLHRKL